VHRVRCGQVLHGENRISDVTTCMDFQLSTNVSHRVKSNINSSLLFIKANSKILNIRDLSSKKTDDHISDHVGRYKKRRGFFWVFLHLHFSLLLYIVDQNTLLKTFSYVSSQSYENRSWDIFNFCSMQSFAARWRLNQTA
jgi:hypothetical protein